MQAFLKNENVPINSINDEGNTPLVIACIRGNTLIANILLEANALIVDNYKKKVHFLMPLKEDLQKSLKCLFHFHFKNLECNSFLITT
ncbi:MAG: ankyrin repeat domain-containing protein [Fusobacterium nucleatum]|nr:ankyrin repeat domain-containing protein [Fusobacterium nucleatum]